MLHSDMRKFLIDTDTASDDAIASLVKRCVIMGGAANVVGNVTPAAVALDPAIVTTQSKYYVEVETLSELTRGQTVVDQLGVLKQTPNMTVIWSIDAPRWKEHLYRCLG
ncbi:nucleoside hydrolase [Moorena sp. SIO3B2]|uniref:nucleoside hydrolase n=1 Tax=Moorena sp. SIO3B2 TaxID=2607827 RepID=UPI00257CDDB5|nr:nucleoside hydrolase [Moorena sp. SIO3B2]